MILNDLPTLKDTLNRHDLVLNKVQRIVQCSPPFTFGVHGDWGAGKTSFLKQLRYALDATADPGDGDPNNILRPETAPTNVITVWFEAWRYQNEPAPVIALIQEIRRQLSAWAQIKQGAKKIANVTVRSIINSIDDVARLLKLEAVPLGPGAIQAAGEKYEKENLLERLGTDSIQDYLDQAVADVLSALEVDNGRVVIFIDDLDRCSAESAFRLLEGLKIYLSLKSCIFIIGMNQQLVVDSIGACIPASSYPEEGASRSDFAKMRAEAYLEKLCTYVERLKPISNPLEAMRAWVENPELSGLIMQVQTMPVAEVCFLPPNPRKLKALVNQLERSYLALKASLGGVPTEAQLRVLLIIVYTYQFHSEIFQRWQFNPGFFSHLQKWVSSPQLGPIAKHPTYFASLQLPIQRKDDNPALPVANTGYRSAFPDPYATNVFWVAALVVEKDMNEQVVSDVMHRCI
ncbi:TPA: hypothetical protein QEK88_002070 [Stenotrophomonas maltophilia]|nr:hypothetical protein [Stenotrophomonas maltophilia]